MAAGHSDHRLVQAVIYNWRFPAGDNVRLIRQLSALSLPVSADRSPLPELAMLGRSILPAVEASRRAVLGSVFSPPPHVRTVLALNGFVTAVWWPACG